jgi:hypothetical protein
MVEGVAHCRAAGVVAGAERPLAMDCAIVVAVDEELAIETEAEEQDQPQSDVPAPATSQQSRYAFRMTGESR